MDEVREIETCAICGKMVQAEEILEHPNGDVTCHNCAQLVIFDD
jgi:ribosomal protein S27E